MESRPNTHNRVALQQCFQVGMMLLPEGHLAKTEDKIEMHISGIFQAQLNCYDSSPPIRLRYFMSFRIDKSCLCIPVRIVTLNSLCFLHASFSLL